MKFIYSDLINFLQENPSKELLSKKLFQLGHEHEIKGDVFDMEFTPNRGDCLSLKGLARDLNVFFGENHLIDLYKKDIEILDIEFENLSKKDCPKISFLEIEIEKLPLSYKPYLDNYFSLLGNKRINFFTDVSNYVSYEQGQPSHCFDSSFIDQKIIFDNKICDDSFKTLLDQEIELSGKNCVFLSGNEIISLAGVMGGKRTACSSQTLKALVEFAYFNPEEIIGKSIKYNLTSDAAYKFERGIDISSQEVALKRFINIIADHALIRSIKVKSFGEESKNKKTLPIDIDKINKILGTNIIERDYLDILNKLGFATKNLITIPSHRHDISSQNDLAEEIARVVGYNNIENQSLNIKDKTNIYEKDSNKLRNFLVQNGFSEVINFPFSENDSESSIKIDNPLDSNRSNLRTSLKSSLVENLLFNERRQKDSIKLFEISNVYSKNKSIDQELRIGIIVSGRVGHDHINFSNKLDQKFLDSLLNSDENGSNFQIEEISRKDLKTKRKEKIFYTEIKIEAINGKFLENIELSKNEINFIKYKKVSDFPASMRDFSFSITNTKEYTALIDYISNLTHENLKESYIFDFYKNERDGEIKVGLRLVFQSTSKTLSEEEIQNSIKILLDPIINKKGISIPGLQ